MKYSVFIACTCMLLQAGSAVAQDSAGGKTLIAYYSRTGNTKLVCETLAKQLGADLLEIKDGTDRSGGWGFFTGTVNTVFNMQTDIAPEKPDLLPYARIIVASPIWGGKFSAAIRTFLEKNRIAGKTSAVVTTTNALLKESSKDRNKEAVARAGSAPAGYWEIAVRETADGQKREKKQDQLQKEALELAPAIKAALKLP